MNIQAAIDGRPVDLTEWQCDSTVDFGYRTMTGKVPASVTWAEQEAPISLWLDDGTELWAGKLTLDPQEDRGQLGIRAEGYGADLAARTERRLFRVDGTGGWTSADSDPHSYVTQNEDAYTVDARPSRSAFFAEKETYAVNDRAGLLFWAEGAVLTRYSYVLRKLNNGAAFEFLVRTATGPSGAFSTPTDTDSTTGLASADPADGTRMTIDLDGEPDLVVHFVNCVSVTTLTARRKWWAGDQKVYGLTTDDDFSISDVVLNVADNAGFDTSGVQTNSLGVLPLDWTQDKTHVDLLDYMAELADWQWQALGLVNGVPSLTFGPFSGTLTGYQSANVSPTWENRQRYNAVRVPFQFLSERKGSRVVTCDDLGITDPFPGRTVEFLAGKLEDPQPNGTLASAVAANLLPYYSAKQAGGRVKIGRLTTDDGRPISGYLCRPGNLLNVAERPDLGPQRVVSMTYRPGEDVTAEVNDEFNVTRLLADLQRQRRRGRRRRR